ncbi:hypothetical protein GQ457_13G010140 [Hibiscus cannabinus]
MSYAVTDSTKFTIVMHHGGYFLNQVLKNIVGKIEYFDFCDVDEMSMFELVDMVQISGIRNIVKFFMFTSDGSHKILLVCYDIDVVNMLVDLPRAHHVHLYLVEQEIAKGICKGLVGGNSQLNRRQTHPQAQTSRGGTILKLPVIKRPFRGIRKEVVARSNFPTQHISHHQRASTQPPLVNVVRWMFNTGENSVSLPTPTVAASLKLPRNDQWVNSVVKNLNFLCFPLDIHECGLDIKLGLLFG